MLVEVQDSLVDEVANLSGHGKERDTTFSTVA